MSIFTSWVTSPSGRRPVELELPETPPAPSVTATEPAEPFVDLGLNLPEAYGVDIVRAMVQDPFHLLVYWEVRRESLTALEGLFPGGAAAEFRPTMRMTDLIEGTEAYVSIPLSGKYWFGAIPAHQYRVDVGALSQDHGFVPIMRSNVVETPRGTVSPSLDDDPQFRVETPRFVKLLEVTGFASDRVLTDLARAEAARTADDGSRLAMPSEPPAFLADAFARLPEEVRTAAAHVATGGSLSRRMVDVLPEQLRAILASFGEAEEQEILTAAFMHLLPQMLRNMLDGGLVDEPTHPFHLPPRFLVGASEQLQRPHVDWSWMPSMTKSLTRRTPRLEADALDPQPET